MVNNSGGFTLHIQVQPQVYHLTGKQHDNDDNDNNQAAAQHKITKYSKLALPLP